MRAATVAEGHVAEILDGLAVHIDKCLDALDQFGSDTRWEEGEDSPLAYERKRMMKQYGPGGDWEGREARRAGEIASLFGQLTAQHLEAIRVLLIRREVLFSIAPLTRSILEVAGHVFWLLDPQIHNSPRDRAARVLLSQIDDATRRVTAAKHVKHPHTEEYVRRLQGLRRNDVPTHFYPTEVEDLDGVIRLRKQSVPGLGDGIGYIEKVTGVEMNAKGMYSYLSNATHPTLHIVTDAYRYDQTSGKGQFVSTDARLPYLVTRAAIVCHLRTWQIAAKYFGLDDSVINDLALEVQDLPHPDDV